MEIKHPLKKWYLNQFLEKEALQYVGTFIKTIF